MIYPDPRSYCYPTAAPHFTPPIQMMITGQDKGHLQLALFALPHLRFAYLQAVQSGWLEGDN